MRRFYTGFFCVLALFIVLNAAPYFFASAPQLRTLGILSAFWRQDPTYMTRVFQPGGSRAHVEPQFYWDRFAVNLGIALAASFSAGRWFQQRGERRPLNQTTNDNVA
jgi:hypothetical protein